MVFKSFGKKSRDANQTRTVTFKTVSETIPEYQQLANELHLPITNKSKKQSIGVLILEICN